MAWVWLHPAGTGQQPVTLSLTGSGGFTCAGQARAHCPNHCHGPSSRSAHHATQSHLWLLSPRFLFPSEGSLLLAAHLLDLLSQDLSLLRSHQTSLAAITSATLLPSSGMLALGSYNPSLLLLDPSTGRRAGTLLSVASTAALSLCAWPAPATAPAVGATASGLGHTSGSGVGGDGSSTSRSTVEVCRDLLAVGDADGSVRLLQLDTDDTVSHAKLYAGHRDTRVWQALVGCTGPVFVVGSRCSLWYLRPSNRACPLRSPPWRSVSAGGPKKQ